MEIESVAVGSLKTNCYILSVPGGKEVLLIDPGAQGDLILRRVGDRRVAAVLLTHGHCDHTGALSSFAGVPIHIHPEDAPMLEDPWLSGGWMFADGAVRPKATRFLLGGETLRAAGIELEVLHTPGHTPGGVCLRAGREIFTGDTLFDGGMYGRTDLPGGDAGKMKESLRMLMRLRGCRAWPGHGRDTLIG